MVLGIQQREVFCHIRDLFEVQVGVLAPHFVEKERESLGVAVNEFFEKFHHLEKRVVRRVQLQLFLDALQAELEAGLVRRDLVAQDHLDALRGLFGIGLSLQLINSSLGFRAVVCEACCLAPAPPSLQAALNFRYGECALLRK